MTPPAPQSRDPQAFERELLAALQKMQPFTLANVGEALIRARAREDSGAACELQSKYPGNESARLTAEALDNRAADWRLRAAGWPAFLLKMKATEGKV